MMDIYRSSNVVELLMDHFSLEEVFDQHKSEKENSKCDGDNEGDPAYGIESESGDESDDIVSLYGSDSDDERPIYKSKAKKFK